MTRGSTTVPSRTKIARPTPAETYGSTSSPLAASSLRIKSEKPACQDEFWAAVANLPADRSESGGEPMSQGRKETPEPTVFVNAADLYRSLPRSQFYERLAQVLDLDFVYPLTQPLYAPRLGRPSLDPVV